MKDAAMRSVGTTHHEPPTAAFEMNTVSAPTMTRRIIPIALLVVAAVGVVAVVIWQRRSAALPTREVITVQRGDVVEILAEAGTVAVREPTRITSHLDGRIQWLALDATWVEVGERVVVISADDEIKRAGEDRNQLSDAEQELAIALLKRTQTIAAEDEKRRAIEAQAAIEQLRYRILTEPSKGGTELVRLDAELRPREAAVAEARAAWESADRAWRVADAGWSEAAGVLLDRREAVADLDTRIREREADLESIRGANPTAEPAAGSDPTAPDAVKITAEIAQLRDEVVAARALIDPTRVALDTQAAARAALAPARDVAAAKLAEVDAGTRELLVLTEIEKRDLDRTRLALDLRAAEVERGEAARKLSEGRAAAESASLSANALADLVAADAEAAAKVTTVTLRLEQASRPLTTERRAQADAELAAATAKAARAGAGRDRAVAIIDAQIAVIQAKVDRLRAQLALRGSRFAEVIETELANREERLPETDSAARPALEAEIEHLRADLEKAKIEPPNVIRAPVAGLLRIDRGWGRPKNPGDQVWHGDGLIEIYPPGNLGLDVAVNQAVVERLAPGQIVSATIPVAEVRRSGKVVRVGGVGRDRNELEGRGGFAGVIRFPVEIALDPGTPAEDARLRQGMSARLEIRLGTLANVLSLPLAAVTTSATGASVVLPDGSRRPITGKVIGADTFVIDSGLTDNDRVVIERRHTDE